MSDKAEIQIHDGGVYKETHKGKVGTGDTTRDSTIETLWIVHDKGGSQVEIELLDMNHEPSGYKEAVEKSEFSGRFVYEEGFEPVKQSPQERQADRHASRGERHLAAEEFLSAEFEFNKSLKSQEDNVRANFGLGKTYVAMGDEEKARAQFEKLVDIDELLDPKHKHIFNEFGIQLRKMGMFKEAVKHYHKALNIEKTDENLWFNFGRALCEGGLTDKGKAALQRALQINPELMEAKVLLAALQKRGL